MSEDFDITLEFECITRALEDIAHFSELAEETLRLLIVIAGYAACGGEIASRD